MASVVACRSLALVVLAIVAAVSVTGAAGSSKLLNITNSCSYTVWPAISSMAGAGSGAAMDSTGFELAPGESRTMSAPSGWSGRVWGRTLCSTGSSGRFTCVTGDCGSGRLDCADGNAAPPVTLAQFTLDASGGAMDLYDVSLVDGFNLPLVVTPQMSAAAGANCKPTGCVVDLNAACPAELRVTSSSGAAAVACKSACQAFGSPQYCCTGDYGNPDTCKPSAYSELFKKACPRAFSYAYDDTGSSSTCGGSGGGGTTYTINFCPSTASGKSSTSPNSQPPKTGSLPPHIDDTTPYTGSSQVGGAAPPWRIVLVVGILGAVTAALGVLAKLLGLFKLCCNQASAGAGG